MVLRFGEHSIDDVKNRLFFHIQNCFPFFIQKLRLHEKNCHHLNKYILCATRPEKINSKSYNFDGLGKCIEDGAAAKLQECLLVGQGTEDLRFKLANEGLGVLMADAYDVFATDILYHKKCYSSYLTQIRKKRYS